MKRKYKIAAAVYTRSLNAYAQGALLGVIKSDSPRGWWRAGG
jgi:hypothetical protein